MENKTLTWVVLAGGRGSRSENPQVPKILQKIEQILVLDFLLDSLRQAGDMDLIFALSHGASDVLAALEGRGENRKTFDHFLDPGQGPVAALVACAQKVSSDYVGVILGDTLISAPLTSIAEQFLDSGQPAGFVVRQSEHLGDSDCVAVDYLGDIVHFYPKGNAPSSGAGHLWGVTGVIFVERSLLAHLDTRSPDVVTAVFKSLQNPKSILAIRTSFYFRDSGTPERLTKIRSDYENGRLNYPRKTEQQKSLFLDRDGTICNDVPYGRTSIEGSEIRKEVVDIIAMCNSLGIPVVLVSNQPAIAKGFIDFSDVYKVHNQLQSHLFAMSAKIDDFLFCPHHPENGHEGERTELKVICKCRKPSIGMLTRAAKDHHLDLSPKSVFLGDSQIDKLTAENARVTFLDVDDSQLLRKARELLL